MDAFQTEQFVFRLEIYELNFGMRVHSFLAQEFGPQTIRHGTLRDILWLTKSA
jgi:hypothetical protein